MDAPVLLTGATGYIGGRLLRHFEEAGRPVRCLARNPERVRATRSTTEVVQGDCLDEASLDLALAGVDSAYYLVHSMSVGADFAEVDRQAAANFGRAAARAVVRRIIYLGGLADQAGSLSSHLQSRAETGSVLRASGIPVDRASRQVTQNRRRRGTAVGLSSGCAIGWRRAIERCDTPRMTHERIRLGISACLLGEPVRLDGGHKRDPFLVESLGQFVDWGAGVPRGGVRLDAPRESMRLVQTDVRLRGATVSG